MRLWVLIRVVSSGHLAQQFQDIAFEGFNVGFDFFQGARRLIRVEVAVEVDFVADFADLVIFVVANGGVYPGIGDCGLDFAF